MGKKKSVKVQRSEDPEEIPSGESDEGSAVLKNVNKKQKKKRKEVDLEDVTKELEDMALEQASGQTNSSEQKTDIKVNGSTKKASKKEIVRSREESSEDEEEKVVVKSKFSGFAALADDDMMMDLGEEEMDDEDEAESSEAEERVPTPPPAPKQTKGKQKGKKDKKVVADDDWDDLEGLVTPPPVQDSATSKKDKNKKENKKNKKGKRVEDDEEDFDKLLAEARLADGVTKSLEDNPEVKVEEPEESKSKKRRKRKGKGGDDANEAEGSAPVVAPAVDSMVTEQSPPPEPLGEASVPADEERDAAAKQTRPSDAVEADGSGDASRASPSGGSTPALADGKSKRQKRKEAEEERKRKKQEEEELKLKKKEEEDEKKRAKKGLPNKKLLAAMKELQEKKKEEEERRKREDEELQKLEDERIRVEEEQKKIEDERKERKKQKEKERKERLKAEGRLLTAKQKADQRRAQEMLEHLKAQGVNIPESGADKKAPRLGSKAYAKKKGPQAKQDEVNVEEEGPQQPAALERANSGEKTPPPTEEPPKKEDIKESWDISSEEEAEDEDEEEPDTSASTKAQDDKQKQTDNTPEESSDEDATEEDGSDDQDDEPQTAREKVIARLRKRKEANENNKDIEKLRAPVVCVLGHVDHGKTKILDKLRRTNVQEGEVGGITQQIGATNVPSEAIAAQTKMVKSFVTSSLKFPGLLIIDTPGHESFSNLRNRGSSLCDLAILVVDITQGLEPQTIESIDLLKKRKTPFVVALNKVDRVFEWESNQHKDIRDIIKIQKETAKMDFERRTKDIIMKLNEQGLNAALFFENPDPRSYVSLVPTSAITGDGMGNLIALVCDMCQSKLATQLRFSEELQCIVLEVKTIQGHGTTIDVILVNGRLREGDNIVLAGTDGPIVTQIRSLLMPKPMKEIRVKGAYDEFKEVMAAQGVKLAAKDLDKAIAGLSLRVANNDDEVEVIKELVEKDFKQAMRSIKVKDKGVYVQASTLGALEALLEFFKTKSIPYSGIRVGPVVKRDVMKAAAMLEHDDKYAVILAFDVRVERDAQELADREGVKIFSEETIYHLGDRYVEYLEDYKRKQQEENRSVAIFPCKLKILPTSIFNKRDPIVLGVTVDQGVLRTGTLLCVPAKEFVEIGIVTSMEFDHKSVDIAKKGVDVCIKIDPSQGTTPKLYGRHFEAPDEIVSKISRESINACKDYFRDDLSKADWKLMAELKKLFNIL